MHVHKEKRFIRLTQALINRPIVGFSEGCGIDKVDGLFLDIELTADGASCLGAECLFKRKTSFIVINQESVVGNGQEKRAITVDLRAVEQANVRVVRGSKLSR